MSEFDFDSEYPDIESACPECGATCLVDDGNYVAIETLPVTGPVEVRMSLEQVMDEMPSYCSVIYTEYERGYNKALFHVKEAMKALYEGK